MSTSSNASSNTIAVIDYGMGNLHSVSKALEHVAPDARVIVTADTRIISEADRVLLPGVGAMRDCMGEIRRLGFDQLVKEIAESGRPLLGVCVGMQAMLDHSEENNGVDGLGLFKGEVRFFGTDLHEADPQQNNAGERLKVPHMGWNEVFHSHEHPLWHNITDGDRFYFVHSYYVDAANFDSVAGTCHYGVDFAAAIARNNIFAAQFHPEKSQHAGLQLLKNFAGWDGRP
ncbi:imidazole glycerol phosphate synthase subunit HisH [Hahella sp. CCB-MM4]|uniref:imidazole glycerol phosphate synthase subunit HisH n=1 Tax=Hahella sp. (strain CCB-MM4) TaxID=1926491 RepID=UPI000B9AB685|nr:imidazole glycerol phosphate synthase subunit HisH [Hahella sp. CCB-MM4]OZG71777.1 imidazole glycerol phosphate synthase subunit HisH [Hahella sp. CCB-MM4]